MKTTLATAPRVITDRAAFDTLTVNGRTVTRGAEVTVIGIRGRCSFVQYVRHDSGSEWVDVLTSTNRSRTVRPSAIRVVHTRRRMGVTR